MRSHISKDSTVASLLTIWQAEEYLVHQETAKTLMYACPAPGANRDADAVQSACGRDCMLLEG